MLLAAENGSELVIVAVLVVGLEAVPRMLFLALFVVFLMVEAEASPWMMVQLAVRAVLTFPALAILSAKTLAVFVGPMFVFVFGLRYSQAYQS